MSKTYIYLIILFGVYLFIVKKAKPTKETDNEHVSTEGVVHDGGGLRR